MKKIFIVFAILFFIMFADAKMYKKTKRPLIEIGPKASLYIGSIEFGIGAEVIFNPLKSIGVRLDLTEIRFGDNTSFYLNHGGSLDALIYIPMRGLHPYVHAGFGFNVRDTGTGSHTSLEIRAGMGGNYPINRRADLFIEPGIIISGNGDTHTVFRLSFGGRFGIFK